MRDFDICPTLINKGIAYKLFLTSYDNPFPIYNTTGLEIIESTNSIVSPKNNGRFFTFFKFIEFIVKCSKATFADTASLQENNMIDAEMFCLMLERMELSKGFTNFEKKTFKPHTSKITLLPSKAVVN